MRRLTFTPVLLASLICVSAGVYAAGPAPEGDMPPPPPCGAHDGSGPHHRGPHGGWPSPEEHAERMKKELGLSDAQAAKVVESDKRFGESMRALHEKVREQHRAEFESITDAHDKDMKAILDAEQYGKWQERREAMRKMHHHGERPQP